MKKLLCVLLSMMLLFGTMSLTAFAEEAELTEGTEETEVREYPEELVAASVTAMKGDFFTEMFGYATSDIDVRALIHGYNLVNWDQNQGTYVLDPTVVTDYLVTLDEEGNKTYTLVLADDLTWSDGTPITAWDYAFSILLMMSPEIEQIGGKIYRAEHILGAKEYIDGRIKAINGEEVPTEEASLGGVDVLDDHQIMITLAHEFLPYFFETGLLLTVPYPISVIAPGCKVYDDGYGIYLGNENLNVAEPVYTAELLKKTILDPETGYNSHPSLTSGPYVLKDFDGVTAHFEINPYHKGSWYHRELPRGYEEMPLHFEQILDEEGNPKLNANEEPMYIVKPTIEKIAFTLANNDTLIEKLADEELNLVNKVTQGKTIIDGMMNTEENGTSFTTYPRIGLSFATFTYDWPTVHEMEVRQAIAWCMDRENLTLKYCGDPETGMNFGVVVNGYYGIEQWEYLLAQGSLEFPVHLLQEGEARMVQRPEGEVDLTTKYKYRYVATQEEYDKAIEAWDALSLDALTTYTVDLDKANELLDRAGWTLNRNGEKYQAGVDDVRCKEIDGNLVALDLSMMYPEGNHMADFMQEEGMFVDNLAQVGIKMTLVPAPMTELLKSYYRETERTTDMIYLATNFHVVVDPSITYSADTTLNHQIWNNTYSDDEDLWQRAVKMRETEPEDDYEYVVRWIAFQERYNEVLPTIPVYSNIYYDFYSNYLQNYYPTAHVTWTQAILSAYFGEPVVVPDEELEDDGEMTFDE